MDQEEGEKVSLVERFVKAMQPLTEDHFYKESLIQSMWSIDQFAALIAGLTPENYKRGERGDTQTSEKVYAKREAYATKVFDKFLGQFRSDTAPRGCFAIDNRIWMSPWRYIKWVVENDIPMKKFSSCNIYYGREHLLDKALELDIDGIFPGTGNVEPRLLLRLWEQRDQQSFALFNQLKNQVRISCPDNYIQGLKSQLKNMGIISE